MVRHLIGAVLLGSGVGCVEYERQQSRPQPPVPLPSFAQWHVREIAISPFVGNREIGVRLAQEILAVRDRDVSVVQIVNAQFPGAVLAWAAVNWAQADGPNAALFHDGIGVLAGCLQSVENWVTPQITVSADAYARDVFACAAYTPLRQPSQLPATYSRALRTPTGKPRLYVHVTADPPNHNWIGQKGLALYLQQTNAAASAPPISRLPPPAE